MGWMAGYGITHRSLGSLHSLGMTCLIMTAPFEPPLQVAALLCFLKDCLGGSRTNPGNTQSAHPQDVVERPKDYHRCLRIDSRFRVG